MSVFTFQTPANAGIFNSLKNALFRLEKPDFVKIFNSSLQAGSFVEQSEDNAQTQTGWAVYGCGSLVVRMAGCGPAGPSPILGRGLYFSGGFLNET